MIRLGDCLDVFGGVSGLSAIVTDPPAGVAFMSRAWDRDHGGRDAWVRHWRRRLRSARVACEPGAYALVWALPRTSHWTACAIDDAGWVIQDVITHHFGSGWPKGRAALKPASEHWILARNGSGGALQIDACRVPRGARPEMAHNDRAARSNGCAGASTGSGSTGELTTLGWWPTNLLLSHAAPCDGHPGCEERGSRVVRAAGGNVPDYGAGKEARRNDVYGAEKRARESWQAHGNGDGTETVPAFDCLAGCACGLSRLAPSGGAAPTCACGRAMAWACPVAEMDAQSGAAGCHSAGGTSERGRLANSRPIGYGGNLITQPFRHGDAPGTGAAASRFFPRFTYQAKAPGGERDAGCEGLYWRRNARNPFGFDRITREEWEGLPAEEIKTQAQSLEGQRERQRARGNVHPTVKSLALMRWLVGLVAAPGGRVGDLCTGSGGTAIACDQLGIGFIGAELCPEAVEIAEARRAWWKARAAEQRGLFGEHELVLPEARKPEREPRVKPAKVEPVDTRTGDLFGGRS